SRVSELLAPERSRSGATTTTSCPAARRPSARMRMPGASTPSSLLTRILIVGGTNAWTSLPRPVADAVDAMIADAARAPAVRTRIDAATLTGYAASMATGRKPPPPADGDDDDAALFRE